MKIFIRAPTIAIRSPSSQPAKCFWCTGHMYLGVWRSPFAVTVRRSAGTSTAAYADTLSRSGWKQEISEEGVSPTANWAASNPTYGPKSVHTAPSPVARIKPVSRSGPTEQRQAVPAHWPKSDPDFLKRCILQTRRDPQSLQEYLCDSPGGRAKIEPATGFARCSHHDSRVAESRAYNSRSGQAQ